MLRMRHTPSAFEQLRTDLGQRENQRAVSREETNLSAPGVWVPHLAKQKEAGMK